jgi:hypothetical protein
MTIGTGMFNLFYNKKEDMYVYVEGSDLCVCVSLLCTYFGVAKYIYINTFNSKDDIYMLMNKNCFIDGYDNNAYNMFNNNF